MQPVMFNNDFSSQQQQAPSASFPNDGLNFYSGPIAGTTGATNNMSGGGFGGADMYASQNSGSTGYDPNNMGSMSSGRSSSDSSHSVFDDEPPLLEELGINFSEIWSRTLSVSIPFREMPVLHEDDSDLAGPLVFCLLLGTCLLLTGKVHFGYIYGFGVVGCLLMYIILNLMSEEAISVDRTMSILGYSILPIVLLAIVNIFVDLRGSIGLIMSFIVITWCTLNATRLFVKALSMTEQRYLIAYPVTMLYACFALLTIF